MHARAVRREAAVGLYPADPVVRTEAVAPTVVHAVGMTTTEAHRRAEDHAREAERLLAGRMGFINNIIKAGVHATLAVYYEGRSRHSGDEPPR